MRACTAAPAPDAPLIRRAGVGEAAAIAGLLARAFAPFEPRYTAAAFAATVLPPAALVARWHEGPVWVAERERQLIGTVAATPRGETVYLRSMAVLPAAQGNGVGRQLLLAATEYATGCGARAITLCTTPFLDAALALYRSFGFVQVGHSDLLGTPLIDFELPL